MAKSNTRYVELPKQVVEPITINEFIKSWCVDDIDFTFTASNGEVTIKGSWDKKKLSHSKVSTVNESRFKIKEIFK